MVDRNEFFSCNNFDLVRLVAATQVLLIHGVEHMSVDAVRPAATFLAALPGVPSFFFISGFLITAAWERNPQARVFYLNRFYRIFPGLWMCVILSAVAVVYWAWSANESLPLHGMLGWIFGQSTFIQAWNPSWLRWFGVGVVNGSLWTIPVEVCFYLLVPVLYWLERRKAVSLNVCLTVIAACSFAILYLLLYLGAGDPDAPLLYKAARISPLPWMGMFCLGALAQRHIEKLYPLFAGRFLIFLAIFIIVAVLGFQIRIPVLFGSGNGIGLLNYASLCMLILSAAYSGRSTSDRILNRSDLSYGTYIYHMPVFNVLIESGLRGMIGFVVGAMGAFGFATLSWFFVERPALRRRKVALYAR